MSKVSFKVLYLFFFCLLCLSVLPKECIGQAIGADSITALKNTTGFNNDSLKNKTQRNWLDWKKNKKQKLNSTFNKLTPATGDSSVSLKKRASKKKISERKEKVSESAADVSPDKIKAAATEKITAEKQRFSVPDSDSLHTDSLQKKAKHFFSKEAIESTLQKNNPVGDYNLNGASGDFHQTRFQKRKRNAAINAKKQDLSRNYGMEKIKDPFGKATDSVKHISAKEIIKKQVSGIKGSVSFGYEYGILPYVSADNYPTGGFKSEGRLSLSVLSLPIEVTYRYSTVKGVIGINNYFRVSYDVNRYKDELDKKMVLKEQLKKMKLDKLQMSKQELAMKMQYASLLANMQLPEFTPPDTSWKNIKKWSLPDGLPIDSAQALSYLNSKNNYLQKKDSLIGVISEYKAKYNEYKGKYDSINEAMEMISTGTEKLKKLKAKDKVNTDAYSSKLQTFLSGIKKFEIGLCNPSYSLFLLSNAPLKGINFEYGTDEHFFAVTYGTTVNSLFYNPNTVQGKLQEARNFYNFFDFNNLANGRKVLALKGGRGQKEGSHIFIGVLIGKGKMDYLTVTDPKYGKKESNVVLELDGKYKFNEQINGEFVLGKSSLQQDDLSMEQLQASFAEIFSAFRSNAAQARLNFDIRKTRTKIQLTSRIIDPYFKSFGVSFLRSDNIRYEVKADQQLTKNIKYTVAYRREEDNLLGLINIKNTFTTIQNSLSVRFKKGISLKLNYAPLLRTLKNGDMRTNEFNSISTAIVSYVPRMKKVQANYNILYSKYRVTSDSGNIHFDNLSYSHQFQFEKGFKTGTNMSWFENTLKDTLNNNTYLGVVDVGYTTKEQNSFTIGGKVAYKPAVSTEFGFLARITLKVYKTIFWETEAEKILTGDYYSSLIDAKIRRFPYYISSKMIINF